MDQHDIATYHARLSSSCKTVEHLLTGKWYKIKRQKSINEADSSLYHSAIDGLRELEKCELRHRSSSSSFLLSITKLINKTLTNLQQTGAKLEMPINNHTPLQRACQSKSASAPIVVDWLIKAKADMNNVDRYGNTALVYAYQTDVARWFSPEEKEFKGGVFVRLLKELPFCGMDLQPLLNLRVLANISHPYISAAISLQYDIVNRYLVFHLPSVAALRDLIWNYYLSVTNVFFK